MTQPQPDARRQRYATAIQRKVVPRIALTSILPEIYEATDAAMVVADEEQAAIRDAIIEQRDGLYALVAELRSDRDNLRVMYRVSEERVHDLIEERDSLLAKLAEGDR